MRRLFFLTLILTLFIILTGCDNGSTSVSSSGSTNGLVKVSLTVGGDAAGISQKSVSVTGDINWLGLSYQYNAVP